MIVETIHVKNYELGLRFHRGDFVGLLEPGTHTLWGATRNRKVVLADRRTPWLFHDQLSLLVRHPLLANRLTVIDLKDHQRAFVWVQGRFNGILGPGIHAAFHDLVELRTEIVEISEQPFVHDQLSVILAHPTSQAHLQSVEVPRHHQGLLTRKGQLLALAEPGQKVYWKAPGTVALELVDMREAVLDISGQELMTSDKVTLRINAVLGYRVADAEKARRTSSQPDHALYREAQLSLREAVGTRDLDGLLAAKETLGQEMLSTLAPRAETLGLRLISAGIRDIILPGEMRDLMNRVIEAKKAAQANLIARQEETAAMRSQANTAKLLESNPTLMRLRELEVLEKVAASGKISVLLGDQGLRDRLTTMI